MHKLTDVQIEKPITILIDGSGEGIQKDVPGVFVVDTKMCSMQAYYFSDRIFPKTKKLPKYLMDDVLLFYPNCTEENCKEMIKTCRDNAEFSQILGLITVSHGVLSIVRKENKGVKLYFEHPECHMHPNRQSKLADWVLSLHSKYNNNEHTT